MTTEQQPTVLTAEEREFIWFIPQAAGGKVVPEHVQVSLEEKGICRINPADGKRWLTLFGDKVRLGQVPVKYEG